MSRRTIQSPGVEIREIDLTQRPAAPLGTSVFVPGFSNQGPTDEVLNVGTFSDFEEIYGKPTNAAERYFYHSVKQVFNSDANVYVSRLPYGAGNGLAATENKYTALVYPVVGLNTKEFTLTNNGTRMTFTESIGTPSSNELDLSVEIISKDANGESVYTTKSLTSLGLSGGSNTLVLTGAEIATAIGDLSGHTFVKAVAHAGGTGTKRTAALSGLNASLSASDYFVIGNPTLVELTPTQYNAALNGEFTWSDNASAGDDETFSSSTVTSNASGAGLIVLNTAKTTINSDYEGYYVGLTDGVNVNPATNFDVLGTQLAPTSTGDKIPSAFTTVPASRLEYSLSATSTSEKTNVSKTLENLSEFNIQGADFVDTISLGLFKVRNTPFSNTDRKLSYFLAEGYTGSLNSYRRVLNQNGGNKKSFFLPDVENNSPNIKVLVNPYISKYAGDWTSGITEAPTKFVRVHRTSDNNSSEVAHVAQSEVLTSKANYSGVQSLVGLGAFAESKITGKNLGSIPTKLNRIFDIASNVDRFNIDVTIEAGLGTVWVNQKYSRDSALVALSSFDDTAGINLGSPTNNTGFYTINENMVAADNAINIRDQYRAVFNEFEQFARETRKDHIFIADILRNIVVQSENAKVLDDKDKNFSQHVYWPIRHQFGTANSNYATVYGNWIKTYDGNSDTQVWIPFSGNAAGLYARNDANFAPWYAPAGYTRGVVTGATDIAISPTQRQRDQLYRIAVNPVTQFPSEGIIVFGQKTLQRKPTAFDRVNVRRLFLDLEKRTRETLKFFIFEPNTFLTRTKVVNTLTPIFENCKQTEGVYDYLIVCDERNNTSATIENNELIVDIYLKPVRAAEFILVNFYAVNNDVNFEEIVGQ